MKKIQQYLLLHHPLVWNTKIVPIMAITLAINALAFVVGYSSTTFESLQGYYSYNNYSNYPLLLFFTVLSGLVILVLWLVYYARNNAFREFYLKRSTALYAEWLMIFVILVSLIITPLTYVQGAKMKVQTFVSKEKVLHDVETINMIAALIPTDKNSFFSEFPKGYAKNKTGELVKIKEVTTEVYENEVTLEEVIIENDSLDYGKNYYLYSNEQLDSLANQKLTYKDFPHFAPLSLLNQEFDNQYYNQISTNNIKIRDKKEVEKWLLNENKEKIRQLIDDFLALAKKHHLPASLTTDQWLRLIYNPPTYPVSDFNLILRSIPYGYNNNSRYYAQNGEPKYFVPYEELRRAYENILSAHYENENSNIALLVIVCIAGFVSLLVFSFRCTSGKTWLIALVSAVLLWIIYGFIAVVIALAHNGGDRAIKFFMLFFWIALFVCELIYLLSLNKNAAAKKYSGVVINHILWLLPFIPMILLGGYVVWLNEYYGWEDRRIITDWIENNMLQIVWADVAFTFVAVWLLLQFVIRRWKSLPEE
ncbi:MAG: hypothetical protein LBN27_05450 [Prevotellaceae bacterium]|jgi:hypothetical protein|nr:hypothetical protein [Prevotellaceae bacterium]